MLINDGGIIHRIKLVGKGVVKISRFGILIVGYVVIKDHVWMFVGLV